MRDVPVSGSGAVVARVTRRLVLFAFLCYVVAYIDRVNIGFAAPDLEKSLGLSDTAFGIAAGLFFLGYCTFEIPSNLLLERVGARLWIARIMIVWGLVSMATMLVTGRWSFYAARVILGIAEAGFFPGMVLYLTYWVPAADRGRTGALFMMAAPIAIVVGAPVSAALLKLDGRLGLAGWQWLFLLEGLPAIVLGLVALRVMTDRPEQAAWLPAGDREWLARTMNREREERAAGGQASVLRSLASPAMWLLSAVYFLNNVNSYGVFLWLPQILRDASGAGGFRLSLLTAIPFTAALAAMVLIGRHSDRTGERKGHVAACAITAAVGLVLAAIFRHNVPLLVLSFALSQIGQRAVMSVFWTIPPMVLGGTAAAAGIALINSIGNLGGAVGPSMMGWLREVTGAYTGGLLVLAATLVVEALLVMMVELPARAEYPSAPHPAPLNKAFH